MGTGVGVGVRVNGLDENVDWFEAVDVVDSVELVLSVLD